MQQAIKLLFDNQGIGKTLFNNQLDLVNTLLSDERTKYYVAQSELDKYTKAQTRLKTYVSQLLSSTVYRSITEDFKNGLLLAVESRLSNDRLLAQQIVDVVIKAIHHKNATISKSDTKANQEDQFGQDFEAANYIAIITLRPLEVDKPEGLGSPPLRKYLFEDLIQRLFEKEKDLKYYRFNFPTDSSSFLFWRLLKRILFRHFKNNLSQNLIESLYLKFAIRSETAAILENNNQISDEQIEFLVDETLAQLNANRYIMVFTNLSPIYSLPIVAMDPSDTKHIKVYAMLSSDSEKLNVFKFPDNESVLWRVFVWDSLKSKKFAGTEVKFSAETT